MNQFHTPSFGDEVFELSDTPEHISKRMRSLDHSSSVDDYHVMNGIDDNDERMNASISINSASVITPMDISPTVTGSVACKQVGLNMPFSTATTTTGSQHNNSGPSTVNGEPAKPVSPYALFFRDTVNAIKTQNPTCTFQEISVIVSKMWEALDETQKNRYNERHELAKQDYIAAMRSYRIKLEQQQDQLTVHEQQQQQQQQQHLEHDANYFNNTSLLNSHSYGLNAMEPPALQDVGQQQPAFASSLQTAHAVANATACATATTMTSAAIIANNNEAAIAATVSQQVTPASPTPQQIQLLTEAAATQKCTREHCNKPAIINPDWEDEYCSNECVVIHCRTVFSDWVKSMMNAPAAAGTPSAAATATTLAATQQ